MSELNSRGKKNYSKFDKMSTEALRELLRLDFELPEGEESDIDAILYITEVIAKRIEESPSEEVILPDVNSAWLVFQEKYRPYAERERIYQDAKCMDINGVENSIPCFVERSNKLSKKIHKISHAACIAAILVTLLFATATVAHAMGIDFWETIAQWTSETFEFVLVKDDETSSQQQSNTIVQSSIESQTINQFESLDAALAAYKIETQLAPTWIPDQYTLTDMVVDTTLSPEKTVFIATYTSGELTIRVFICMHQELSEISFGSWEKSEKDVIPYDVGNVTHYIMENAERPSAVWLNGPFECNIFGDISHDDMIHIINSIYE